MSRLRFTVDIIFACFSVLTAKMLSCSLHKGMQAHRGYRPRRLWTRPAGCGGPGGGRRLGGEEEGRRARAGRTRAPTPAADLRPNDRRPRPVSYYRSKYISRPRSPIWKRSRAVFWTSDWQCRVKKPFLIDDIPVAVSILAQLYRMCVILPHLDFKINSCFSESIAVVTC